jgi:hypothetical protein
LTRRITGNWMFRASRSFGVRPKVTFRELPDQVVQGRAQVLNRISNDKRPFVVDLDDAAEAIDHSAGISLVPPM